MIVGLQSTTMANSSTGPVISASVQASLDGFERGLFNCNASVLHEHSKSIIQGMRARLESRIELARIFGGAVLDTSVSQQLHMRKVFKIFVQKPHHCRIIEKVVGPAFKAPLFRQFVELGCEAS
jgi:hypothetical protein